jgi:hypothetical protein
VLALAAWLVAMWALLRMVLAAFMDPERRSLLWLLSPSMPLANYNRNNLRLFAACILFLVAMVILLNVLALTGYIKPTNRSAVNASGKLAFAVAIPVSTRLMW